MRRLVLLACGLLIVVAAVHAKEPKNHKTALRILKLLEEVDGAGSGLDADTVQGVTPMVVRDAEGKLVGGVASAGGFTNGDVNVLLVRKVNAVPVMFFANGSGLSSVVGDQVLAYASMDCSGAPRAFAGPSVPLIAPAASLGTRTFYAEGPGMGVPVIGSEETTLMPECTTRGGTITNRNTCCTGFASPPSNALTAPAIVIDISSFGLVPPLHVEGPGS